MEHNGWISLHRRIKESSIFMKSPEWLKIWIYLLLEVDHQTGEGFFKWGTIQRECKITHQQLRDCLKFMEEEKMIAREKLPRGVKIIVQNWLDYQNKRKTLSKTPSKTLSNTPSKIGQEVSKEAEQKNIENFETLSNTPSKSNAETPLINTIIFNNNINNKRLNTYIRILNFWNSLKIIEHKDIPKLRRKIEANLKIYTPEELEDSMKNYAYVLSCPDKFYWTYKWQLKDFLDRGIERFLPINFKESDYLKRVYKSKAELEEERSMGILNKIYKEEEEKEDDQKRDGSNLGNPEGSI